MWLLENADSYSFEVLKMPKIVLVADALEHFVFPLLALFAVFLLFPFVASSFFHLFPSDLESFAFSFVAATNQNVHPMVLLLLSHFHRLSLRYYQLQAEPYVLY